MHSRPWWQRAALTLALFCAVAPVAARAVAGSPGGRVHVRWQAGVDEATRQRLESQYRLLDPEQLDERTWRYDLVDPRPDTIRAIVNDAAVADTHDINRDAYTLDAAAVRTARRQRFPAGNALVASADALSIALAIFAALLVAIGLAGHGDTPAAASQFGGRVLRSGRQAAAAVAAPLAQWLLRGIPEVDARTAGIFRVLFGLAVLMFFEAHAVDSSRLAPSFDSQIEGPLHATVLQWLRERPAIVDWVGPWLLATGIAFTAGLFTRATYALFVAGAIVWAYVAVSFDSTHPHSTLILTLVALLPSRWGDGFSIDRWLRPGPAKGFALDIRSPLAGWQYLFGALRAPRTAIRLGVVRQRVQNSRKEPYSGPNGRVAHTQYGYSVWVPGLIVGVAFAAAAWSKLSRPDGWDAWIMNGSVKYHFITDSVNAPVDWGLQLAAHPQLAILASFATVAIEALAITAAFTRSEAYRLAIGLASLGLVAGFRLFMGVLWLGWWIPLLGFLPWRRLSARSVRLPPSLKATADHRDGPLRRTVQPALAGRVAARPDLGGGGQADQPGPASRLRQGYGAQEAGHYVLNVAQVAMIVFLLGQQLVVSTLSFERAPMFTNYPMYSYTFDSPEQFNAWLPPVYRIVVTTDAGNVELRCRANENLVEALHAALGGSAESAANVWRAVRACRGEDLSGARALVLEEDRYRFDWDRLRFTVTPAAVVHGPLKADADTGC